jgi:hypothetical protein
MWTRVELDEISQYFGSQIENNRNIKEAECREAIKMSKENSGEIHRRSWETIKKKVNYILVRNRKK